MESQVEKKVARTSDGEEKNKEEVVEVTDEENEETIGEKEKPTHDDEPDQLPDITNDKQLPDMPIQTNMNTETDTEEDIFNSKINSVPIKAIYGTQQQTDQLKLIDESDN